MHSYKQVRFDVSILMPYVSIHLLLLHHIGLWKVIVYLQMTREDTSIPIFTSKHIWKQCDFSVESSTICLHWSFLFAPNVEIWFRFTILYYTEIETADQDSLLPDIYGTCSIVPNLHSSCNKLYQTQTKISNHFKYKYAPVQSPALKMYYTTSVKHEQCILQVPHVNH